MKKYNVHAYLSGVILLLLLIVGTVSCKKEATDFSADPSYKRLFKPWFLGADFVSQTSARVFFYNVAAADKYIIEVSDDSLQFTNIVKRYTFLADTLTVFAPSTVVPAIVYRELLEGLYGNTRYSARLYVVNKDSSLTSKYVTSTFKTLPENRFSAVGIEGTTATIKWRMSPNISYLGVYKATAPTINILGADSILTAQQISDTTKVLTNLEVGSTYIAKITYVEGSKVRVRGIKTFKVPGTIDNYVYNLLPTDNVNTVLTTAFGAGNQFVTLNLTPGAAYAFGTLTVPTGLNNLTISCSSNTNLPTVTLTKIAALSMTSGLYFENVNLVGAGSSSSSNILLNLATNGITIGNFSFEGCKVSAYYGLINFNITNTITASSVSFNNCIVSDIGKFSILNVQSAAPTNQLNSVNIQNSTFVNLSTLVTNVQCQLASFVVINCTFFNNSTTNKLGSLFRFNSDNTTPTRFVAGNFVLSGANGGTSLQSFNDNHPALTTYSFGSCYKTSELGISGTAGKTFTSLIQLNYAYADFFNDAANGNFSVKPGVSNFDFIRYLFGDPRWW